MIDDPSQPVERRLPANAAGVEAVDDEARVYLVSALDAARASEDATSRAEALVAVIEASPSLLTQEERQELAEEVHEELRESLADMFMVEDEQVLHRRRAIQGFLIKQFAQDGNAERAIESLETLGAGHPSRPPIVQTRGFKGVLNIDRIDAVLETIDDEEVADSLKKFAEMIKADARCKAFCTIYTLTGHEPAMARAREELAVVSQCNDPDLRTISIQNLIPMVCSAYIDRDEPELMIGLLEELELKKPEVPIQHVIMAGQRADKRGDSELVKRAAEQLDPLNQATFYAMLASSRG